MSQPWERAVIGRTIARKFLIESFIGEGAMGAVYRARQIALEKIVAIKVLHPDQAGDAMHAALFQREAKAASRLDHPNSVRVVDFGQEADGLLYIAMEYFAGRDLQRVLQEDWPLSAYRVADILSQALAAIAVAHEMGMVHRDLKPENILVQRGHDDEGAARDLVKVCDFGIAKFTDAGEGALARPSRPPPGDKAPARNSGHLTEGLLFGTPHYMSPEQAQGESLDARTDLYSMGIILYQMLTSRVPFDGETLVDVMVKHVHEDPVAPKREAPWVDGRLEAVCLKALKKRRQDRYQSAREMRADLRAVVSAPPSAPTLPPTQTSRNAPTWPPAEPARGEHTSNLTPAPALTAARQSRYRSAPTILAVATVVAAAAALRTHPWHQADRVASPVAAQAVSRVASEPESAFASARVAAPPIAVSVALPAPLVTASTRDRGKPSLRPTTKPTLAAAVDDSASTEAVDSASHGDKRERTDPVLPALLAATTGTANPTVLSMAPPPLAMRAVAAGPRPPPYDPSHARVTWSVGATGGGATAADFRRALSRVSVVWNACYQDALRMSGQRVEGSGALRIATDEEGNVVQASVTGFTLSSAPSCIAASARVRVAGVDTGSAWADVKLVFRAEPAE